MLTPQARLLHAMATLAPGLTGAMMEAAARLLPGPAGPGGDEAKPGWQQPSAVAPSLLTRLVDRAARRNNELDGRAAATYDDEG